MKQTIQIDGMTCVACEAKVQYLLKEEGGANDVKVNLDTGQVDLSIDEPLSLDQIKAIFQPYDKYTVSAGNISTTAIEKEDKSVWTVYKPLLLVAGFVALVASAATWKQDQANWMNWMQYFMAGFFIAFSFFKFLDLKGFAGSFQMYDPLAVKVPVYGKLYPFLELLLGLMFLIDYNYVVTNIATIVLLGISTIGVVESVLNKRKIQCACIGTIFDLPMSKVTIIENSIMIAMAIAMLWIR
jgi:copper chaperone CopZ